MIGCGTGGLIAVSTAAENGADVIGIDRFSTGTGIRTDIGATDSKLQKAAGTKIDKFEFIAMGTLYAGGHVKQDLYKLWANESGAMVDWYTERMKEAGIQIMHEVAEKDEHDRYKHFPIGHSPQKTPTPDLTMSKVMNAYARKKGAKFDYNTTMVKLEKKDGRVTAVSRRTRMGSMSATSRGRARSSPPAGTPVTIRCFRRCSLESPDRLLHERDAGSPRRRYPRLPLGGCQDG